MGGDATAMPAPHTASPGVTVSGDSPSPSGTPSTPFAQAALVAPHRGQRKWCEKLIYFPNRVAWKLKLELEWNDDKPIVPCGLRAALFCRPALLCFPRSDVVVPAAEVGAVAYPSGGAPAPRGKIRKHICALPKMRVALERPRHGLAVPAGPDGDFAPRDFGSPSRDPRWLNALRIRYILLRFHTGLFWLSAGFLTRFPPIVTP